MILAILDWVVNPPITALSVQRIKCTAQCPFCGCVCSGGVACQNEALPTQRHRAEIHMPQVINCTLLYLHISDHTLQLTNMYFVIFQGFLQRFTPSNRLISGVCTSLIATSNTFKLTRKLNIKYNITHDNFM
jgi:hypothetical protein